MNQMFFVKVGYYGDACDVCGKEQVDLLQPMVQIVANSERGIIAHKLCLVKRINEAIEKFDAAFRVKDKRDARLAVTSLALEKEWIDSSTIDYIDWLEEQLLKARSTK